MQNDFNVADDAPKEERGIAPGDEIVFEIRLKSKSVSLTKSQLFGLARTGEVLPDTVVTVAGVKVFADSLEGIVFGNEKPEGNKIEPPQKTGWFYYDAIGEKLGPFTNREFKHLAKQGLITPETLVENQEGKSVFARKVQGLKFHPSTPAGPAVQKTTWFYYDAVGEKFGPFTNRQFRELAAQGVITPETRIENAQGQSCLAKKASGFRFPSTTQAPDAAATPFVVPVVENREEEQVGTFNLAPPDLNDRADDHDEDLAFDNEDDIEGEPIVLIARELVSIARPRENATGSEFLSQFAGSFNQGSTWLRANFSQHKLKIISGVSVLLCILAFFSLFAYWQGNPHGMLHIVGTLTLDGLPVEGARVILLPRCENGRTASGTTDSNGRFVVRTYFEGQMTDGAKAGEYDVTFAEELIPKKYGTPETSGLAPIILESKGQKRFSFELSTPPPSNGNDNGNGNGNDNGKNGQDEDNGYHPPDHIADIFEAARQGTVLDVTFFIEAGVDVNATDRFNAVPLHHAAGFNSDVEVLQYLVAQGANLGARNAAGYTPLHAAAHNNRNVAVLQYLIEQRVEVNAKDNDGNTPLHIAVQFNPNIEVSRHLASRRASINATNNVGNMPLHVAAQFRGAEILQILISRGAHINAPNNAGNTPLHLAAHFNPNVAALRYLLSRRADVDAKNNFGSTPYDVADTEEKKAILRSSRPTR